jgi:sulfite oxidase
LSDQESSSQWQQRDYKCFGPNVGGDGVDWDGAPAIQEMPVQSAVTAIQEMKSPEGGGVEVQGYAYSGGGRRIVRVDVSVNDGRTWHQAELLKDETMGSKSWAWTRWRWAVPWRVLEEEEADGQRAGKREFVVKAVDEVYNTQPEHYDPQWNFKGNLTNAWHRVECPTTGTKRVGGSNDGQRPHRA